MRFIFAIFIYFAGKFSTGSTVDSDVGDKTGNSVANICHRHRCQLCFFFIFHIEPIFTFEPVLNFRQGLNITAAARFGGDFDVQNDGQVKRAGRAEFMKRVYDEPKSFLEALSSIFDVPFYSNRQG